MNIRISSRVVAISAMLAAFAVIAHQTAWGSTPQGPGGSAAGSASADAVIRRTHVETHPSLGTQRIVEGAEATLTSTSAGSAVVVHTKGLTPGHIYSLWMVVVNKPSACATSPCTGKDVLGNTSVVQADVMWGFGGVVGADGALRLHGWMPAGKWESSWFGRGLTNPKGAEFQLIINDHGAPLEGRLARMLTSYREGCSDDSLPPPFPEVAKKDGTAGPNRCALTQSVVFERR